MRSKDESYINEPINNEPINEGGLSADQTDQESLSTVLDRILTKARRFTRAEAGTIYVREGNILRFVAVQNDALARRLGEEELQRRLTPEPLELSQQSLAGFVGITGRTLDIPDAYHISSERPYRFDGALDERNSYRTVSVLLIPIHDPARTVLGVLQLINALDSRGRPVPFRPPYEYVQHSLASYAAIAIRNAQSRTAQVPAPAQEEAHGASAASAQPLAPIGRRLGELLTSYQLITNEQLGRALAEQNRTKDKLGAILVRMGAISEDQLVEFLARQYKLNIIEIPDVLDPEVLRLVPAELTRKHELVPVQRRGNSLIVAMGDPTNLAAVDDIAFLTSLHIIPGIAPPSRIRRAIEQAYQIPAAPFEDVLTEAESKLPKFEIVGSGEAEPALDLVELRSVSDQAPIVRLVDMLLMDAIRRRASDIHLEPFEGAFRVRFRIDGVLQQIMTPPKRLAPAITSRIKIMADLDIAERRRPQDGHFKLSGADLAVDFRVATLPTVFGEGIILRILDRNASTFDPSRLGFNGAGLERLQEALRAKNGLILITGPTGSGKSTTLYAALQTLNSLAIKIITIEDPVEYRLEGVNQVQVNEDVGRTFATSLRSLLRSDPDVIMVGEMRDVETAQIAVRAALTGHLVLSTLHTNDSAATVARLLDMGVPSFLLAASLRVVLAQRLVRMICPDCPEAFDVAEDSLVPYGYRPTGRGTCTLFRGRGCPTCNNTGLKGRVAIYEIMPMSSTMRDLIAKAPSIDEIRRAAMEHGMQTLREAALQKVVEGVTTLDEILRVISE